MADYLTERLKKDLEKRGIIVSDDEASSMLRQHDMRGPLAPQLSEPTRRTQERLITPGAALLPRRGEAEVTGRPPISEMRPTSVFATEPYRAPAYARTDEEEEPGFGAAAWDFVGSSLWGFADTASFGVAGWLDTKILGGEIQETLTGVEAAAGKWGEAFGGLAGFIVSPLKVGVRAARLAAKPFIKAKKIPLLKDVTRDMVAKGMKGGKLSKEKAKWVAGQYENVVSRGKYADNYINNFTKHADDMWKNILERGVLGKQLTRAEAKAVNRMFKDNIKVRPMQDFVDLFRTSLGGKKGFIIGSMVNEAVMFGAIDAIFETVHASKDERGYDWTAPLWGVGVGAGFGLLKWLPARGKQAKFKRDFVDGIKGAFAKDTFKKLTSSQIYGRAHSIGKLVRQSSGDAFRGSKSKPWIIEKIPYMGRNKKHIGKTFDIDLSNPRHIEELSRKVGNKKVADDMLKLALQTTTRQYGKRLTKWAMAEEWGSIKANWHRMMAGSIIMNARTFIDAYRYDIDLDIHDVLPHVLIGAWVNRHGAPAAWDLNVKGNIDNLRGGLNVLGIEARNLNEIPTFDPGVPSFLNPVTQDAKQKGWLATAEKYKIISDNFEDTVSDRFRRGKLGDINEKSAFQSGDPDIDMFKLLRRYLTGIKSKHRPLDRIPEREALEVVKQFKKANGIETLRQAEKFFERKAEESTDLIEDELNNAIVSLSKVEGMEFNSGEDSPLPKIYFSHDLESKLGVDVTSPVSLKVDKIFTLLSAEEGISRYPSRDGSEGPMREITSEESFKRIEEIVRSVESAINENAGTEVFDLIESYADIAFPMVANNYRKTIKAIDEKLFAKEAPAHDILFKELSRLGIMQQAKDPDIDPKTGKKTYPFKFVKDVGNIEWTGTKEGETESLEQRAKQVVGSVISILAAKGQYNPLPDKVKASVNIFEVMGDGKTSLSGVLKGLGFRTDAGILRRFQGDIVDYLIADKVKGSQFLSTHVDFLYNLSETEGDWGGFKSDVIGKDSGFYLYKIKEVKGTPWLEDAKVYNNWVNEVIAAGRPAGEPEKPSLVHYSGEKIPLDFKDVIALNQAKRLVGEATSTAKIELMNLLNALEPRHGPVKHRIEAFAMSRDHRDPIRLVRWLENLGILTATEAGGKLKYDANYEAIVDKEVIDKLNKKLNDVGGLTQEQAVALHEIESDRVRDMTESKDEYRANRRLTLSEFYIKYEFEDHPGADYQNQKVHMDNIIFTADGDIKTNAINEAVSKMIFKANEKNVPLKEIKNIALRTKIRSKAKMDVLSAALTRVGRQDQIAFSFLEGNVKETVTSMQGHPLFFFLRSKGIEYFPLIGEATGFELSEYSSRITRRYYNIFEADGNLPADKKAILKFHEQSFIESLGKYSKLKSGEEAGIDVLSPGGFVMFKVSSGIQPFAIRRESIPSLVKAYNDLMKKYAPMQAAGEIKIEPGRWKLMLKLQREINGIDKDIREGDRIQWEVDGDLQFTTSAVVRRISDDGQSLFVEGSDKSIPISEAYRTDVDGRMVKRAVGDKIYNHAMNKVLGEMITTGKDDIQGFIELINGGSGHVEKVFKRFNLVATKNFRRENVELVRGMHLTPAEKVVFNKFQDAGEAKVVLWDDAGNASVRDYVRKQFEDKGMKWENIINNPGDKSAFDSISYVSRDYMSYLSLMHGFYNPITHNIIKPVVSSLGENTLLLGKTIFVWDPYLEGTFFRNNKVDILMTSSAAKIRDSSWDKGWVINETVEGMERFFVAPKHVKGIPLTAVGVMPNDYAEGVARQSDTLHTFMNPRELNDTWNKGYAADMDNAIKRMAEIATNPIQAAEFLSEAAYKDGYSVESVMAGEGSNQYESARTVSAFFEYHKINPLAAPSFFSRDMLKNRLYQHFITPIINKHAIFNGKPYGGKGVLIQSMDPKYRELLATLVDKAADGKPDVKQYGEVVLPLHARDFEIADLIASGFEMRFIDRSVSDVSKQVKSSDEMFGKEVFETMMADGFNLGQIFDVLADTKVQIGIISNRYPRTRPNDVLVLGLHSFLAKEYGNSMIVNPMDVFNIFEGDYDVDRNDYYFAQRSEYFNHSLKTMETNFVQGINPDELKVDAGINFGMGANKAWDKWSEYISNSSIMTKGIGIGQKLSRKLNHLSQLFPKDENGHYVIMQYTGPNGEKIRVVMDYDNTDMFQRLALETQAVIDAGSRVDFNLFDRVTQWADEFLFPSIGDSVPKEGFGNIGFVQRQMSSPKKTKSGQRVRIFKKTVDGKEINTPEFIISKLEKEIIKSVLNNYGRFLQLGTKIFDPSGERRAPSYNDAMDGSRRFFNFFGGDGGDIGSGIYGILKRRRDLIGDKTIRKAINEMFRPVYKLKRGVDRKKYKRDGNIYTPVEGQRFDSRDFYWDNTTSPWAEGKPFADQTRQNAGKFFTGKRGGITDRVFNRLQREDPAGDRDRQYGELTGETILELDNALSRFIGGTEYSYDVNIKDRVVTKDEYVRDVVRTVRNVNDAVYGIKSLKRKFGAIYYNKRLSQKQKKFLTDGINESIGKLEDRISSYLDATPYGKSRKAKDLPPIRYVSLEDDFQLRHATTQLYTLRSLFGSDLSEIRSEPMDKHIRLMRNIERIYYGDRQGLHSSTLRFGEKTILDRIRQEYLADMPDETTFAALIERMMDTAVNKWGPVALYKYAMPAEDLSSVGILGNTTVPVPWLGRYGVAPKRYERVIRYMAKQSMNGDGGMRDSLNQILAAQTWFDNLINRKLNWLPGETALAIADPNHWFGAVGSNSLRIPDFSKPFVDTYNNMSSVEWSIGSRGRFDPFQMWDDHLIQFYRDIYKLAGQEGQFNNYMESVSGIRSIMASYDMIDPFHYLAVVSNVEADIHKFVNEAISNGIDYGGKSQAAKDLRNNRIFILMGGAKYFDRTKDISLNPIMRMSEGQIRQIANFIGMGRDILTKDIRTSEMKKLSDDYIRKCLKR